MGLLLICGRGCEVDCFRSGAWLANRPGRILFDSRTGLFVGTSSSSCSSGRPSSWLLIPDDRFIHAPPARIVVVVIAVKSAADSSISASLFRIVPEQREKESLDNLGR
jgi:hypothetical protein